MISMILRLLALSGLVFGLWQVAVAGLSSLARAGVGSMAVAAMAAQVRGDLWADAATGSSENDQALGSARAAVTMAPLRSDMWLQLAAAPRPHDAAADHATPLLMAYMVGSGKRGEWPGRFMQTVRTSAVADEIVASFFKTDLALALKFRPDAEARVKEALKNRDSELVAVIKQVDPNLVGK